MSYYAEKAAYSTENQSTQAVQQIREAERVLSEFSSSLSNYDSLLDKLSDRLSELCISPMESPQRAEAAPKPRMSLIGTELSSRIADFDDLNHRLCQLLNSLSF